MFHLPRYNHNQCASLAKKFMAWESLLKDVYFRSVHYLMFCASVDTES